MDWISQRGNDKYYRLAKRLGQPSRAFFKLAQINRKYRFLDRGRRVIDFGSSPGGWVGYELERVQPDGRVVAVDLQDIRLKHPLLVFLKRDVFELSPQELLEALGGRADVVLSDLAPHFTGIRSVDMARHFDLATRALELATQTMNPQGWFLVKLFMSQDAAGFIRKLNQTFESVKIEKPPSSRSTSSEIYAVCRGLKTQNKPA